MLLFVLFNASKLDIGVIIIDQLNLEVDRDLEKDVTFDCLETEVSKIDIDNILELVPLVDVVIEWLLIVEFCVLIKFSISLDDSDTTEVFPPLLNSDIDDELVDFIMVKDEGIFVSYVVTDKLDLLE